MKNWLMFYLKVLIIGKLQTSRDLNWKCQQSISVKMNDIYQIKKILILSHNEML